MKGILNLTLMVFLSFSFVKQFSNTRGYAWEAEARAGEGGGGYAYGSMCVSVGVKMPRGMCLMIE